MIKFFENIPEILAIMSEQKDGSMKLFDGNWNLDNGNGENRKKYFEKKGINNSDVVFAYLKNGTNVEIVEKNQPRIIKETDGIVTKQRNIYLAITAADCIPVYFYETTNKIIALSHCGWRGIVDGIIKNTVNKILEIGGKIENLKIAFGPGINKCHFEIKEDVLDKFGNYPEFIIRREGKMFVDLKGIIRKQLADFGINFESIEDNNECTMEGDKYFSYRRDKPKIAEAMIAVIGIVK